MTRKLRVAVADDEPDVLEFFKDALLRLGHNVVAAATSGAELLESCRATQPDLVITDVRMDAVDGFDAAWKIYEERPVAIIVISAYQDEDIVSRAEQGHILAFLAKPVREAQLGPAIAIAMRRFEELRALQAEADGLRQALADRKTIERAKGLLMKRLRLDEEAAFRKLQKLAEERRIKLIEAAGRIVDAAEILEGEPPQGP
jgi:response regulator NasT